MDKFLRFSDYDIFAYLTSGFAALVIWDLITDSHFAVGAAWSVSDGVLVVMAAYILGQIIASPASLFLERWFARHALGSPADVLTRSTPPKGIRWLIRKSLFAGYYKPLDAALLKPLRKLMDAEQVGGDAVFARAHASARGNSIVSGRLDTFLRLYGLCRNLAFVGLAGAAALVISATLRRTNEPSASILLEYAAISALVGVGMLFRYLKFYRLFGLEVLSSYASLLLAGKTTP